MIDTEWSIPTSTIDRYRYRTEYRSL